MIRDERKEGDEALQKQVDTSSREFDVVDGEVVRGQPSRSISGVKDALNRVGALEKQVEELQGDLKWLFKSLSNKSVIWIEKPPSVQRQEDEVAYLKSMEAQAVQDIRARSPEPGLCFWKPEDEKP